MSMIDLPAPPHIPVSGADHGDIEATAEHIELLTALAKSAILENVDKYRQAVLRALTNHNENVAVIARPSAFKYALGSVVADFCAGINDVAANVVADVRCAQDDLED